MAAKIAEVVSEHTAPPLETIRKTGAPKKGARRPPSKKVSELGSDIAVETPVDEAETEASSEGAAAAAPETASSTDSAPAETAAPPPVAAAAASAAGGGERRGSRIGMGFNLPGMGEAIAKRSERMSTGQIQIPDLGPPPPSAAAPAPAPAVALKPVAPPPSATAAPAAPASSAPAVALKSVGPPPAAPTNAATAAVAAESGSAPNSPSLLKKFGLKKATPAEPAPPKEEKSNPLKEMFAPLKRRSTVDSPKDVRRASEPAVSVDVAAVTNPAPPAAAAGPHLLKKAPAKVPPK